MTRVYAEAMRAMANKLTFGPNAELEKPGNAMGQSWRPFFALENHESTHAVDGIWGIEPEPTIMTLIDLAPKPFSDGAWIRRPKADRLAALSATETAATIVQLVRRNAELAPAKIASRRRGRFLGHPVVLFDVAVRAEEQKAFGMVCNLFQIGATGLVYTFHDVVELKRTVASMVATTLATATERIDNRLFKFGSVRAIQPESVLRIVGLFQQSNYTTSHIKNGGFTNV
jgi:hypothetical protein